MKPFTCFLFFAFSMLSACDDDKKTQNELVPPPVLPEALSHDAEKQPPSPAYVNMEVKTFEVIDSLGNSRGWGYSIFIDDKRVIHQPIIPAIAGNISFKTEDDAWKTGLFALEKMKKEGALPTLSLGELDSLGVTK